MKRIAPVTKCTNCCGSKPLQDTFEEQVDLTQSLKTKLLGWYKWCGGGISTEPSTYQSIEGYVQAINLYHTRLVCFIVLFASLVFFPSDFLFLLDSAEQFQRILVWRFTFTGLMALGWLWCRFLLVPSTFTLWKWTFFCIALCIAGCSVASQLGPFDEPWMAIFLIAPFGSTYMVMDIRTRAGVNSLLVLSGLASTVLSAPLYITFPFFPTFVIYAALGIVLSTAAGVFFDIAARENFSSATTIKQQQEELNVKVEQRTKQVNQAFQQLEDSQEQVRQEVSARLQGKLGHLLELHQKTIQQFIADNQDNPKIAQLGHTFQEQLSNIKEATHRVVEESDSVEQVSLSTLLTAYSASYEKAQGPILEWSIEPKGLELPAEISQVFSQTIKEALTNIRKHAKATNISVSIEQVPTQLTLSIKDDGVGFDPQASTSRHGLKGLRERAKTISASFQVQSALGKGTALLITLEKQPTDHPQQMALSEKGASS